MRSLEAEITPSAHESTLFQQNLTLINFLEATAGFGRTFPRPGLHAKAHRPTCIREGIGRFIRARRSVSPPPLHAGGYPNGRILPTLTRVTPPDRHNLPLQKEKYRGLSGLFPFYVSWRARECHGLPTSVSTGIFGTSCRDSSHPSSSGLLNLYSFIFPCCLPFDRGVHSLSA